MHHSAQDLEVLRRFFRLPEGKMMLQLLERRLSEQDVKNRSLTGEEAFRGQGRALEVADLIDTMTRPEAAPPRPARRVMESDWQGQARETPGSM